MPAPTQCLLSGRRLLVSVPLLLTLLGGCGGQQQEPRTLPTAALQAPPRMPGPALPCGTTFRPPPGSDEGTALNAGCAAFPGARLQLPLLRLPRDRGDRTGVYRSIPFSHHEDNHHATL